MLFIRVEIGEEIKIGDNITLIVSRIHGNRVATIGINAPKEIPVHRAEYLEKLRRQSNEVALFTEFNCTRCACVLTKKEVTRSTDYQLKDKFCHCCLEDGSEKVLKALRDRYEEVENGDNSVPMREETN